MGKNLEEVLAGLTGQQIRAIVLKGWDALGGRDKGEEGVRRLLAGELRFIVEELVRQQPVPKPPLVGTVVKTLHLKPNKVESIKDAIELGRYDSFRVDIMELFGSNEVVLTEATDIQLVQFNRGPLYEEVFVWGVANHKKPILGKHLHAIGIQHPDEQRKAPILELGSVRHGNVLCLYGDSDRRLLERNLVETRWNRECLFGFLSE